MMEEIEINGCVGLISGRPHIVDSIRIDRRIIIINFYRSIISMYYEIKLNVYTLTIDKRKFQIKKIYKTNKCFSSPKSTFWIAVI